MDLKYFFMDNAETVENQQIVASSRFKDDKGNPVPWEIRPLSEAEIDDIRRAATRRIKGRRGAVTEELDQSRLTSMLIIESVVFPSLKSEELQRSWGVVGAESLLSKMLLGGEYAFLGEKVQELSGFDEDPNQQVEDLKNESPEEMLKPASFTPASTNLNGFPVNT